MAVFKRGGTWWYEFVFAGQRLRESTKSRSKTVAIAAERARRRQLEEGFNGVRKRIRPRLFSLAAQEWLELKRPTLAPRSYVIEKTNLNHLLPVLGKLLISDIAPEDISRYQQTRLEEGASPKTVNLEVGTVRGILRRNRLWANIQQDIRLLDTKDDFGRAISGDEEVALLKACLKSRSRCLYPATVLALNTGMRYSDVRLLKWDQVDLADGTVIVGKSKTKYGTGRVIPLNSGALRAMRDWANQFPGKKPEHYVFPSERYGAAGDAFEACAYHTNSLTPIGSFKKAWQAAKRQALVVCRFHDLRHTACTRMLEGGVPFSVVAAVMGWSPATTSRMVKRYGHIGQAAQREAVTMISRSEKPGVEEADQDKSETVIQ